MMDGPERGKYACELQWPHEGYHRSGDFTWPQIVPGKLVTDCPKTRDFAARVLSGLTIMRDDEDDEDSWLLPDLATIGRAISALHSLVQRAEDRHRFKIALDKIGKEWKDESPEAVRQYARSVAAGGSARVPMKERESV